MRRFVLAACALPLLAGCATVTRGTTSQVSFTSEPSGIEMRTSNGFICTTPCDLDIPRKQAFTAIFLHDGQRQEIRVTTRVAGDGVAGMAGNVLVGGLVGIAVDASTGATLEHVPNPVHATFPPAPQAPAAADPVAAGVPAS